MNISTSTANVSVEPAETVTPSLANQTLQVVTATTFGVFTSVFYYSTDEVVIFEGTGIPKLRLRLVTPDLEPQVIVNSVYELTLQWLDLEPGSKEILSGHVVSIPTDPPTPVGGCCGMCHCGDGRA